MACLRQRLMVTTAPASKRIKENHGAIVLQLIPLGQPRFKPNWRRPPATMIRRLSPSPF